MGNAIILLPRATGTVRWFDTARGHGFVTRDGGGPDCFVHQSSFRPEDHRLVEEGTRLGYDVMEDLGGPAAVNILLL